MPAMIIPAGLTPAAATPTMRKAAQDFEAQALSQSPNHYTFAHENFSYVYMMIDSTGRSGIKELQDPRVRRALMMAVNPAQIIQVVAGLFGVSRLPLGQADRGPHRLTPVGHQFGIAFEHRHFQCRGSAKQF